MDGLKHPNVEKIVLDVTKEDNIHDVVNTIISDRKSTRLNSSHSGESRMPSSA